MPVAVALWSTVVKPGQAVSVIPPSDLVITNAALGTELADTTGRTSVKLTYTRPVKVDDDSDEEEEEAAQVETVLCSLTPGKIEHCTLNLTFENDDEFLLEVVGKNEVYLTGNYVDQAPDQVPMLSDEDESEEEDEYALDEVSSDVQMDPADMVGLSDEDDDEDEDAGRFEEVVSGEEAEVAKSAKRPRESNATEQDAPTGDKLSKKAKKKLKAENGAAVPAPAPGPDGEASKKGKKEKRAKKGGDAKESPIPGEVEESEPRQKQGDKGAMQELPNGLKIQDAKLGEGPQAKKGAKVSVRYIGKLLDGKVFDSNTKGKPFTFRLGAGEVIKGWDEGVSGMKVGGERLLIIPPSLGYGKRKMSDIPANSTLRFEVKLVDTK